ALALAAVAWSVSGVPDPVLMRQPAKTATPLPLVLSVFPPVQLSVPPAPPPVPDVIDRITGLPVRRLPPASFTVTCGCCANAVLPVAVLLGCWVNVTSAGAPN